MVFEFDENYFQDELRGDFLVTECMKRYWAASLKTVEFFDDICKRHNLTYWADCGTLLGAFRHHGFIPWDDDIDLGMPRKDYDKFLQIAKTELPEGFFVSTFDSGAHRYNGITVILNHAETLFTPDILLTYYNCPFPVGFDLYPYDICPEDENDQQQWRLDYLKSLKEIHAIRDSWKRKEDCDYGELERLGVDAEKIAGRYADSSSEDIMRFIFFALNNNRNILKKKWCFNTANMPFETATIPVPLYIEEVLISEFGADYVRSVKAPSAHNYPLYRRDISKMIGFLRSGGIELKDLPPMLQYIRREAEYRGIE